MSLVSGPGRGGARSEQLPEELQLHADKHVAYIQSLDTRKDELEYWLTEHLRLNGLYWGLTALHLLGAPDALPRSEVIDFVLSCMVESGGFGAAPGHDAHMLYTVSAVQILATLDAFEDVEARVPGGREKIGKFIANLQDPTTGTFFGDEWGESDTRFLYGAFNALSLLGLLHTVDVEKAVAHVQACANFDGGFGTSPGAESHSGQVFTCVGALAIAGRLDLVERDKLGAWLSERQLPNGGLNGRPEKLEDVCYSWWVMSAMAMIDRLHWIDGKKLADFILKCQDPELGGFADRPGDAVDVFHTVFALAGLSLVKHPGLQEVDPVYCMPKSVTQRVLKVQR
ncbi:type-2 protein geranylgeranyltransferase subunit beta [Phyllosticta citrichinensis]|uniref:Geranylgeranyl transferase type-2 subunit beta n=1 Tax=Phyllosticta citrichinensis TaxID=1130410 RepID=A0ABR1Y305_9PEZI